MPMPDQSPDFRKCIERGGLSRVDGDPQIVAKEILVARQDLSEAEASIKRGSFKWATVQAYYAMFHIARALVYQSGYREKSHRCLAIALRELYVQPGRLDEAVLAELEDARALREEADYRGSFSETAARQSMRAAQRFVGYAAQLTDQS
jgi:uncharacterized protein (UPF0332 family)